MGNFYTNVTVRGVDRDALITALSARRTYVFVDGPDAVVFDAECEEQDPALLARLGAELSRVLEAPTLSVLNHDDDVLLVFLHDKGALVSEYNSSPGYFDGRDEPPEGVDAEALCAAFEAEDATYIENALREPGAFALERHAALVEALALPDAAVGSGYTYIASGEMPQGVEDGELISTGSDA